MAREIKFRVWSEEDEEYRTDCNLKELFTSTTGSPATVYSDEGDRFDIEQYTGLKDRNGKEIYEGDLLKIRAFGNPAEVRFDPKGFAFMIVFQGASRDCGRLETLASGELGWGEFEVIGNIHEKELSYVEKN